MTKDQQVACAYVYLRPLTYMFSISTQVPMLDPNGTKIADLNVFIKPSLQEFGPVEVMQLNQTRLTSQASSPSTLTTPREEDVDCNQEIVDQMETLAGKRISFYLKFQCQVCPDTVIDKSLGEFRSHFLNEKIVYSLATFGDSQNVKGQSLKAVVDENLIKQMELEPLECSIYAPDKESSTPQDETGSEEKVDPPQPEQHTETSSSSDKETSSEEKPIAAPAKEVPAGPSHDDQNVQNLENALLSQTQQNEEMARRMKDLEEKLAQAQAGPPPQSKVCLIL